MRILAFPLVREARRRLARQMARTRRADLGHDRGWMCLRDPETGTLGLVTLLGMDRARALRFMEAASERLTHIDRLVFVLTCDAIAEATRRGAVVEQLPGVPELCGGQSDAQVAAYLEARFAQVQRKWEPDFTFVYGLDIGGYTGRVLNSRVENEPQNALW